LAGVTKLQYCRWRQLWLPAGKWSIGEAFIQALNEDFERHGAEVIERVRIEKPEAYLKVIASLLPKDLNLNVSKYDHLTDEQLIVRLRMLTEQAAPILGRLLDHDPPENDQTRSEHTIVAGNLLGPLDHYVQEQ
jgi:hypothetical protein